MDIIEKNEVLNTDFWRMHDYKVKKCFEFTCKIYYCVNMLLRMSMKIKELCFKRRQIGAKVVCHKSPSPPY